MESRDEPPPRPDVALELHETTPPLAALRHLVSEVFADLAEDSVEDLHLVVTELVSNAYDHGTHPRQVRIRRLHGPDLLRVEVDDGSPDQPVLGKSRINDTRGRGLIIVDKIAKDWGVSRHAAGKTVWADLWAVT